ncbi:alginate lyase family protein [Desulfoluna butyratoxydans]|nr:alginate lyase family protein [Desulfoluna butyratoxydans]
MTDYFRTKIDLFKTLLRLGPFNIIAVALYRCMLLTGLIQRMMPRQDGYIDPLFTLPGNSSTVTAESVEVDEVLHVADELLNGTCQYFGDRSFMVGSPPQWFTNPFNGHRIEDNGCHWSDGSEFDTGIGDIKTIWEVSRFDWMIVYARAYRLSGDDRYFKAINDWSSDWTQENPLNCGPNWRCAQEASIRVLQTLLAAFILRQHKTPLPGLMRFVSEHCQRIFPTIYYALAQDNNHGTSEAAALYVCGAWLAKVSDTPVLKRKFLKWSRTGRLLLETRVSRLIEKDGSFAQYSVNYHRVVLDTLNMVEFWRRELKLRPFSERFYSRVTGAVEWLCQLVDPYTGDAPNLGANDGARLFVLSTTGFRDYRPSVQLGGFLYKGRALYPGGPWDESLKWLRINNVFKRVTPDRKSCVFKDGGYATLVPGNGGNGVSWGLVRCPIHRFRPGHADALHFDLWTAGQNVLRDAGSFGYNADSIWQSYFPGAEAHNTVQFDGRDQMPRLGRFLFGAWTEMESISDISRDNKTISWSGSYIDYRGCRHQRTVSVDSEQGYCWRIVDVINGPFSYATLRWRLMPGKWVLERDVCRGELADIKVQSDQLAVRRELVQGWESKYYLNRTTLPVWEIEVGAGTTVITTEVRFKDVK